MTEAELAFLQSIVFSLGPAPAIVEVGSWKGRSTVALCEVAAETDGRVYAGDVITCANHDQDVLAESRGNTSGFDCLKAIVSDSVSAAGRFPATSLDMVFVDADHSYAAVLADITAWRPKLKPGGLLVGHDWNRHSVRAAVRERFGDDIDVWQSVWRTQSPIEFHPLRVAKNRVHRLRGGL